MMKREMKLGVKGHTNDAGDCAMPFRAEHIAMPQSS